jgi:glycosyltransferase involved in cell wall biosynthesis
MRKLECPIAEQHLVQRAHAPLLSVFIPTWRRTREMVECVRSIASQIEGGLEDKVELVISDNSEAHTFPETQEAIRQLAKEFPSISYYFNARNEGAQFQVFAAPWRTTGRWTWIFGSDDMVFPGGIAAVLQKLEAEDPSLMVMNCRILERDLSERVHSLSSLPDHTVTGFAKLMAGTGFHQPALLSCCIENTEAARAIDPISTGLISCGFAQVIAYFARHRDGRCTYLSSNHLGHRTNNTTTRLGSIAFATAVDFPLQLHRFRKDFGLDADYYEQINGSRRIDNLDPPKVTFVDNMFEFMVRSIAEGIFLDDYSRINLTELLAGCRPGRLAQFEEILLVNERTRNEFEACEAARLDYERRVREVFAIRNRLYDHAFLHFTDREGGLLRQAS